MPDPTPSKPSLRRPILAIFAVALLLTLLGVAASLLYARNEARALAGKTSVLFSGECTARGHSPSGEEVACAGSPRLRIFVDGRDESDRGELRALDPGSHVTLKVEGVADDVRTVACEIVLVGYRRTLAKKKGVPSVTCEATIP